MSWAIPAQKHTVFERNPLVAVVVELRFHPILQVPNRIADFQERVRATFPGYQELSRQLVTMGPLVPVEVRPEKLFNFHKADGSATLTLSSAALAVESRQHEHHGAMIADVMIGVGALNAVHGHVDSVRLGLRYVDVIDREKVAEDLGHDVRWDTLIAAPFLSIPTGMADLDGTLFASEVGSSMPRGGSMTVRHGLVQDADGRQKFRLDVDRYVEGKIDAVAESLEQFAADTFSVFSLCMGPDLKKWMPERKAP